MVKNIVVLMEQLNNNKNTINFSEILKICVLDKILPHSKGEIYFLISTLKALGIFENSPPNGFKINWEVYEKLKIEDSI